MRPGERIILCCEHRKLEKLCEKELLELGKRLETFMSIKSVLYIPCFRCNYTLIGKTESVQFLTQIGSIRVFEVTTSWVCLRCQCIQRSRTAIREVLEER